MRKLVPVVSGDGSGDLAHPGEHVGRDATAGKDWLPVDREALWLEIRTHGCRIAQVMLRELCHGFDHVQ